MKKLIRCTPTGRFLTTSGSWTQDVDSAADFPDVLDAYAMQRRLRLRDVVLYYHFGEGPDTDLDFSLPLD